MFFLCSQFASKEGASQPWLVKSQEPVWVLFPKGVIWTASTSTTQSSPAKVQAGNCCTTLSLQHRRQAWRKVGEVHLELVERPPENKSSVAALQRQQTLEQPWGAKVSGHFGLHGFFSNVADPRISQWTLQIFSFSFWPPMTCSFDTYFLPPSGKSCGLRSLGRRFFSGRPGCWTAARNKAVRVQRPGVRLQALRTERSSSLARGRHGMGQNCI